MHEYDEEAALAAREFNYDFAMKYVNAQIAAGDRRLDRIPGVKGAAIDAIVRGLENDLNDAYFLKMEAELKDMEGLVAQREQARADDEAERRYNRGRSQAQVENDAYESAVMPRGI